MNNHPGLTYSQNLFCLIRLFDSVYRQVKDVQYQNSAKRSQ